MSSSFYFASALLVRISQTQHELRKGFDDPRSCHIDWHRHRQADPVVTGSQELLANLYLGIAIFDPALKQEKEQREHEQYVLSLLVLNYVCRQRTNMFPQESRVQRTACSSAGRAGS